MTSTQSGDQHMMSVTESESCSAKHTFVAGLVRTKYHHIEIPQIFLRRRCADARSYTTTIRLRMRDCPTMPKSSSTQTGEQLTWLADKPLCFLQNNGSSDRFKRAVSICSMSRQPAYFDYSPGQLTLRHLDDRSVPKPERCWCSLPYSNIKAQPC